MYSQYSPFSVALFTRAWIEMCRYHRPLRRQYVALFTRAWIEITHNPEKSNSKNVALFTRAWIEMPQKMRKALRRSGRPLYEGVD